MRRAGQGTGSGAREAQQGTRRAPSELRVARGPGAPRSLSPNSASDAFALRVRLEETGELFHVTNCRSDMTVRELKEELDLVAGIPFNLQRLQYLDQGILMDDATLKFHDVVPGGIISLCVWHYDGWTDLVLASVEGDPSKLPSLGITEDSFYRTANSERLEGVAWSKWTSQRAFVALYVTSHRGHADAVKFLLEHGANCLRKTPVGRTPLHAAAATGHMDCIHLLINYGASINTKDAKGETPVTIAHRLKHRLIERQMFLTYWMPGTIPEENILEFLRDIMSELQLLDDARNKPGASRPSGRPQGLPGHLCPRPAAMQRASSPSAGLSRRSGSVRAARPLRQAALWGNLLRRADAADTRWSSTWSSLGTRTLASALHYVAASQSDFGVTPGLSSCRQPTPGPCPEVQLLRLRVCPAGGGVDTCMSLTCSLKDPESKDSLELGSLLVSPKNSLSEKDRLKAKSTTKASWRSEGDNLVIDRGLQARLWHSRERKARKSVLEPRCPLLLLFMKIYA
ncbi:PREDICTED: ankyrin repeat domain-containing protein 60 [Elephantulus edwardii]|uniref:ankyrin repeat domain-containing protein 60 n=1 Tax=Elephantulus edwardii TaxID=28737 RepID=UPI0003F0B210|nr:PREDICTED: ankyrin repeat domain-containing protein 60 [Elephantulus edwardii]